MHVDPFVLQACEAALDFLEIGQVVHLAEIRKLLLGAHAQRVDVIDRAAERAVLVHHRDAVPGDIGLVDRDRLEHLNVVAEQREIWEHVDVDRLRRRKIEQFFRARAEAAAQFRLIMLAAGRRPLDRPQAARALDDIRALVFEVVAVAGVLHVHGLGVGRALVIRHALVGLVGEAVLHLQQRAVREHNVIAITGIVVGELPVALVFEPVGLADRDLAAGLAVEPFVDRPSDGAEIIEQRWRVRVERAENKAAIAVDARHLGDVEPGLAEVAGIAVGPRHRAQLAGIEIAPAVIGTGEDAGGALVLAAERGAAMGAAVEQRADFSLRVPQQDDRAQAKPRGDVIIVIRNLALVSEIDPHRAEDVHHLGLEDRGIGVDQPVDAVLLHEVVPIVEIVRVCLAN